MKKKALLIALMVLVLALGSVVGTLAYLTAQTSSLVNTFKTGAIKDLKIDEVLVDGDGHGDLVTGPRFVPTPADSDQEYPLYPGAELDKDPTVTVGKGSVPCYVFIKIVKENISAELAAKLTYKHGGANGINPRWEAVSGATDIYVYCDAAGEPQVVTTADSAATLDPIFDQIFVDGLWDGATGLPAETETINIKAKAFAHQAKIDGKTEAEAYGIAEGAAKGLSWGM